jgi:hypothetical protein
MSALQKFHANCRAWLATATRFVTLHCPVVWHSIVTVTRFITLYSAVVWHSIVHFPKLFEALLVFVGLLQGYVLWRTDEALHLAANAQQAAAATAEKMRMVIEATERPWIGPSDAVIEGTLAAGKRISTTVPYLNTGREPAPVVITTFPTLFTREEWNNGGAEEWITAHQEDCMTSPLPTDLVKTRIAYPTTGFTAYLLHMDSDDFTLAESDRFLATDKFMSGDEIFVLQGCFVYGTTQNPHHSSFCFYYDHNVTDVHHLSYCLAGQRAD